MLRNSLFAFTFATLVLCPVLVRAAGPETPATSTPAPASTSTSATSPPPDVVTTANAGAGAGGTVAHLEDIQAQTMLYKAQLLRDRALTELQKLSTSDSLPVSGASLPYDTSATQSASAASARDDTPPLVVQITGEGKTFSALIRTNHGNQLMVHAGNIIPGTNLKVDNITFDAVTVSNVNVNVNASGNSTGKQRRILAFAED